MSVMQLLFVTFRADAVYHAGEDVSVRGGWGGGGWQAVLSDDIDILFG